MKSGIFTWPLIIVVVIICALATVATMQGIREAEQRDNPNVDKVSERVVRHPVIFNPILLIYVIVGVMMVGVIFFFWAGTL